jgi:hypothetical protein
MKPYRNIYMRFVDDPSFFKGQLEIPYTGELYYQVEELPEGYDSDKDVFYGCHCDLGEIKRFVKVSG